MKPHLIASIILFATLSCAKEQPKTTPQEEIIPASEIKALRQELEELKSTVAALTTSGQEPGVSVEEFNALKKENEELKAQVELLMSDFFEVEGLRFNLNGDIISTQQLQNQIIQEGANNTTLTTTRTLDEKGRLVETMSEYSNYSYLTGQMLPYYWTKTIYEYNGKTRRSVTQTSKSGLAAGVPYEESISETTYW